MYESSKITNKFCHKQSQHKSNMKDDNKTNSTPKAANQSINLNHQNKKNSGRVKIFIEVNKKIYKIFPENL